MTRALITDPAMPAKARAGRRHTVCIGCNQGCIGHYHAGLPIACTINPWTGHEITLPRPAPVDAPGTVVVVGAGPAGAAAAGCAAAQGHRVVVFERGDGPGGQMRLAVRAPGHAEIAGGLIRTLEGWLEGCDVRYGVEAGVGEVLAEAPDRVVVAAGADPFDAPLAGDGPPVVHAWDVLSGSRVAGRVIVADWGGDWTGLAVAELLAADGAAVRLVTSAASFGETVHQYQRNMYLARLDELGVELVHHLRPVGIVSSGVEFRNVFSDRAVTLGEADAVVVNHGRSAAGGDLYEALVDAGADVVRVGDALGPRSFEEAIREGTEAVVLTRPVPVA
jgi:NADPH-dependent 2,4-dienoyl-CoA reductase/sulfur reductase-like enzyme